VQSWAGRSSSYFGFHQQLRRPDILEYIHIYGIHIHICFSYSSLLFTFSPLPFLVIIVLNMDCWASFQGLIRLLSTCASGSLLAAKTLLLLGISGTIKDILSGSGLVAGTSVAPALSRPADQVITLTSLFCGASLWTSFLHLQFSSNLYVLLLKHDFSHHPCTGIASFTPDP
jgi:hypothetical protein